MWAALSRGGDRLMYDDGRCGQARQGRRSISGTSKAPGTKALWHPQPLSNTLFATADLGLNHYQKKGAPLDRKMERQSVCKWVCVRERGQEK